MADGGEKDGILTCSRKQTKYGTTTTPALKTAPSADTYLKHYVSPKETIQGIALQHGVTVSVILLELL